jgi:hypothetical protein
LLLHRTLTCAAVASLVVAACSVGSRAQTSTAADPNSVFDRVCHDWGARLKQAVQDRTIKTDDQMAARINDADAQLEQQLKVVDIPGGASNFTAVTGHLYSCLDREATAAFGRGSVVKMDLRPTVVRSPAQGGGTAVVPSAVADGTIKVFPALSLATDTAAAKISDVYEKFCDKWGGTLKQIATDAAIKTDAQRDTRIKTANAELKANVEGVEVKSGIESADLKGAASALKSCVDTQAKSAFGPNTGVKFAADPIGSGPWKIAVKGLEVSPQYPNAVARSGDFLRQPMPPEPTPAAPAKTSNAPTTNAPQPKTVTVAVCYSLVDKVCRDKDSHAKWIALKETGDAAHNEIRTSEARAEMCKVDSDALKQLKVIEDTSNLNAGDKNKFIRYVRWECVPRDLMRMR